MRAPKVVDQPGAADTAVLAQQYEQLRQVALGGHAEGWRHGLSVLTGRGMAAWMRARTCPQPSPVAGPVPARLMPATPTGQVVAVLAQMALAHA